jgi:hypothetical protein
MATTMTLRGIDEQCAAALKERAQLEGLSLNSYILKLLKESLGLSKKKRSTEFDDLDGLAGTWSVADAAEFAQATAVFEKIDDEMWK